MVVHDLIPATLEAETVKVEVAMSQDLGSRARLSQKTKQNKTNELGVVVGACNPNYLGG